MRCIQVLYAHTPSGELVSFAVPEPLPPSRSLRVRLGTAARRRRPAPIAATATATTTARLDAARPTAAFGGRSAHDVRSAAFVGLGLGTGTGTGTSTDTILVPFVGAGRTTRD